MCVHPTACNPRLRRTTCCGANTLCSSCASSCFASRCDLRTLLRRCYIAFWGAAKIARTTCPMSCPQQRAPRGLQRSPERRSYAVAESDVRAPGCEWRWFPEPRRTAHWCVVALCFSARVPTLSGALAAHLALTLPCFAPRLIRIVKLPAPECHALVVVAVWCQASITWPWAPQSRAIAWASQFVRALSSFDRMIQ